MHFVTKMQLLSLGDYCVWSKNLCTKIQKLAINIIMHDSLLNLSKIPYWLTVPGLKMSRLSAHGENIPATSDVAIVGVGCTGLSVAIALARAGRKFYAALLPWFTALILRWHSFADRMGW